MAAVLDPPADPGPSTRTTKRALVVACHAMERAFDANIPVAGPAASECAPGPVTPDDAGLVLACFQQREHFDKEAARYGAMAANGHTVIVAFAGTAQALPAGVTAVSLRPDDSMREVWLLFVVRGAFAATLDARDIHELSPTGATLEESRMFMSWSTMRRQLALQRISDHLDQLAPELPPAVVARARAIVAASAATPVSPGEDRLARAADDLIKAVDSGHEHAAALRLDLLSSRSRAERDQLTGLHNRHHLMRYLDSGGRSTELMALLVDVDGLKQVNDSYGHEAGDAVLRCVAASLRANSRPSDVLVRWGGDEFLVLVPYLDEEAGLRHGQRLARAIATADVEEPWQHITPSVSVGVCPARGLELPMAQLDVALYRAKRAGLGGTALYKVDHG